MAKYVKWIGGTLGWAIGGPIGAVIGFALGALLDSSTVVVKSGDQSQDFSTETTPGDFTVSFLILSAAVMKADGKTLRSELEYVKTFLVKNFGSQKAGELLPVLGEILKQDIPLEEVCAQIRQFMPESARLQLLHYLYGISKADGEVHELETKLIDRIADLLHLSKADSNSIKAMYFRDAVSDYKILEITSTATEDEIKKAYRKMAVKYHPDKVEGMGPDVKRSAEEKFKQMQEAYENIKKQRGMK
ncbi:MAG: TerB family tellurite resistance protein [Bacteroidia bacterium]|nr:TerB family tellurite resistance protein [Bacteroidia bacterium]